MEDVPTIRLVTHLDVLGEGDGSVTVDSDAFQSVSDLWLKLTVVVVDGNEVAELQVTGKGASL